MGEMKENSFFCPFCGEQILKNARLCRFCKNSVSYDLFVFKIPGDQRRGEISRKIFEVTQKKYFPSFGAIRKSLEADQSPFLVDISQEDVEILAKIFSHFDLGYEQLIHKAKNVRNFKMPMAIIGGCLIILVAGFFYISNKNTDQLKQTSTSETIQVSPTTLSSENSGAEIRSEAPISKETRANIENLLISTATIRTQGGSGSAFFVSNEGHLISNQHVTRDQKEVEVLTYDGRRFKGTVLKSQSHYDLSLIKIENKDYPPLKLGDATKLHTGETLWTIGAPSGLEFSVTRGIASYVGRNVGGKAFIQSDADINPGNSGGPMINEQGEVIGVNNFIIKQTSGLNFAIPVNYLYMGSSPILKDIVPTEPDSGKMVLWRSWEGNDSASKVSVSEESHPESFSAPSASSNNDINNLLKQLKDAETLLENFRTKMDNESKSLDQKISVLNIKFQNETTVSEQEKIEKEIRKLQVESIDVKIRETDAFLEYNKTASGLMIRAKQISISDETKTKHYDKEIFTLAQSKIQSENNRAELTRQRNALSN
jgi:S1-C subfamily serine protease